MPRQCAFCPTSANMTLEHLWSEWIGKALQAYDIKHRRKTQSDEVISWRTKGFTAAAKVVCEGCNGGWMSALENASKQILEDMIVRCKPVTLSPREITTIAAITFKNMVVADYMKDNDRPPFFTNQERWLFRKTLILPKGLQMWFGSMADSSHGIFKSFTVETPCNTAYRYEVNIFTYAVGHFLIQSTCFKWKRKSRQKYVPSGYLTPGPEWSEVAVPLWPNLATPIDWPARLHLGYQLIEKFAHRFDNASTS
jgi:hypothetical protein